MGVKVLPGVEGLLTPELLTNLNRSGFLKRELSIETCKMDCTRRSVPHQPDRLRDRVLHHSALDGSYTPHPLPTSRLMPHFSSLNALLLFLCVVFLSESTDFQLCESQK